MRFLIALFVLLPLTAFAIDVPIMSFQQQVMIVVEAKKDLNVLDLRIQQNGDKVSLRAIVDKNIDRKAAREIANHLVILTKAMSLDDKPKDDKVPGKGLYNYDVDITLADGVMLLQAEKPAKKTKLDVKDPGIFPAPVQVQPWTHADAAGQSDPADPQH